ncbi:hybrid sensor histidine kinase/response regulator [Microvirga sp. Mcv34]|uniref:hybrid sensor histidine kinase/response regulator n=1 Tax=Microvirga sp. Mcv34 TaxID=2926016 RepID=UPI0021C5E283|nr:hybrid sensor histidine kinase/response regulator [Microvirga sp. Mcv34]
MRLKPSRFITSLAPALVLVAGIVILSALALWRGYQDTTRRGEEIAGNLVHVLAEQSQRTFQAIDFTLEGIRDTLEAKPDLPPNDPRFQAELKERVKALPYVRGLIVVGPDGFLTHDTGYPRTPRVSVADRDYFKIHQDEPNLGLDIGHPIQSRVDGSWVISISRRIDRPDGSFGGVVVAVVDPFQFESFYRGLAVGRDGFIALLLRDGTMLARSPASEQAMGKSFIIASATFRYLPERPHGVYWSVSPVDGISRVVGYKALGGVPAVVLVGLASASVYRSWYEYATVVVATVAVLLGLVGVLSLLVRRGRERERAEQERLGRAQRLEALGHIAGGIAHDFGNTIRIVQSTCALLKPSVKDDPDARSLISDTERFLKGAKDMTERLLAFARRQELKARATRIDERIAGFVSILNQASGPRAAVELKLNADGAVCLLDPVQFEAALLNLVLNARDAMPYGGTIVVETAMIASPRSRAGLRRSFHTERPWVQIAVVDSGIGMSHTVLEQAFDPFFTTKGPGQGSGLGLSQVLGFVQQSAGEVRLESKEGCGTRIRLVFPTIPVDRDETRPTGLTHVGEEAATDRPPGSDPVHGSGKT